jgi:hypothetical protein
VSKCTSLARRLAALPVVFFLACLIFLCMGLLTPVRTVTPPPTLEALANIYNEVVHTPESRKLGKRLTEIARERVECYAGSPLERGLSCNQRYITDIVYLGRKEIHSAPDMGHFLENVRLCPIAYAICMGEQEDGELCLITEARCIESIYDMFWRGSPLELQLAR